MIKKNQGFTLIEILIGIIIVVILLVGINNMPLLQISEAQKAGIFKNKIINNIETAINNSLIGKTIDNNSTVPKYWKIQINNSPSIFGGTGNLIIQYGSGTNFKTASGLTINSKKFYNINNLKCKNIDNTNTGIINSINIYIENGDLFLSGCSDNKQKIFEFDTYYKNFKKHIIINSINNIVNSK